MRQPKLLLILKLLKSVQSDFLPVLAEPRMKNENAHKALLSQTLITGGLKGLA